MIDVSLAEIASWAGSTCPAGYERVMIDDVCKDSRTARPAACLYRCPGRISMAMTFWLLRQQEARPPHFAPGTARHLDIPLLRVSHVLSAYQAIAAGYRDRFSPLDCWLRAVLEKRLRRL